MSNITNKKQEHQMSYRCNCTLSLPSGSSQQYQYKEIKIWKNPQKWKKKKLPGCSQQCPRKDI